MAIKGRAVGSQIVNLSYPVWAMVGILVIWQIGVMVFGVPEYLLPAPSRIVVRVITEGGYLFRHTLVSIREILLGFALSIAVGIPTAVIIVYSRPLERTIYPVLVSFQTVPKVAVAPLFIIWFGFGILPKILVAFLIAFFPIVIDTVVGLRSVEPEMLYLVRSMGANPLETFFKIRFPNALPNIFAGLKVAITLAVVGAIVGEFVGADAGLGYVLVVANGYLDTVMVFATIAILALVGIILFEIIDILEKAVLPWHVSQRIEVPAATM
ncbi:MAG: ABC transporter permease [Chloroflexi bacterium]|nr:ABC transporter permease [Chloroflexota bacterium]MCL5074423.1 ABC transporter permease [Chloroflexota bacterium]